MEGAYARPESRATAGPKVPYAVLCRRLLSQQARWGASHYAGTRTPDRSTTLLPALPDHSGHHRAQRAQKHDIRLPALHLIAPMQKKLAVLAVVIPAAAVSVIAAANDLTVPGSWRNCQRDSDCSLIVRCGSCCSDDAINKEKIEDYRDLYRRDCRNPRPLCPCAYRETACKQGVCQIAR